jgi:hypothetical protein
MDISSVFIFLLVIVGQSLRVSSISPY